ncbi:acyl-CoA carboxylase epsilon subunit-like protein [Curtobacterium sp. PhB130]|uniref:acyl-CoA carboxylase subunit epsilon n=1 Tax=unclassified Curtobacterium TaxID=257496 RepID=UPI000FC1B2B1|nr:MULTISPECIES: acyl-CoA carboxylase subunit epsilon [unclassified Curtobacterium]ROP60391.1 acyl-CoA carboxylase epsilon subunit-like protein [Curtobacterium sp. ZW137]ROS76363.1 acyl-CoA carboxylase epsilon subunit-like protein [Curtobacterium sp. PhB130]TCK59694.1 acyl-CoA carboxylase epsilon subunit-like protein [Curtobacterium sp. PhB136]
MSGRHAAAVPAGAPTPVADVQVVSGDPTPEELAAVVAVLQRQADEAAAAGRAQVEVSPRVGWETSARGLRKPLPHGPGAWSRSLR